MEKDQLTIGEKIELLSAAIFNFAYGQFEAHGIDPALGKAIFDSARNRVMDLAFNQSVSAKMTAAAVESDREGTIEELKMDFETLYGDGKKEAGC